MMKLVSVNVGLPLLQARSEVWTRRHGQALSGRRIEPLERATHKVTVSEITRLYARDREDLEALRRVVQVETLPESWLGYFRHQMEKLGA